MSSSILATRSASFPLSKQLLEARIVVLVDLSVDDFHHGLEC